MSGTISGETTISKVFEPTNSLRWNEGVLEQKWKELQTGETVWKPIPDKSEFN